MKNRKTLKQRIADAVDDIRNGTDQRWGSVEDTERVYSFTHSMTYFLINQNLINSRVIRGGPKGTGRRFIDFASVEAFLNSCPTKPTKGVSLRTRRAALIGNAQRAARKGAKR
jgi:hypothetical protein